MSIVNSKMNASTLDNNILLKSVLKKQRDNLVKLVDLGLTSIDSVSNHEIWQVYNSILNSSSINDLSKQSSMSPNVDNAIKTYQKRLDEARSYDLIKKTR